MSLIKLPSRSLTPTIGWGLVAVAFAVGYAVYGWAGVLLAFTITVFWLLLQFSRVLRTMRTAAGSPLGAVHSALMLSTRLEPGMKMIEVIGLTRSIGLRLPHPSPGADESWEWRDSGGDAVVIDFARGRVLGSTLMRQDAPAEPAATNPAVLAPPPAGEGPT